MTVKTMIKGLLFDDSCKYSNAEITVRYTKDRTGETISFTVNNDLMILIPAESIREILNIKE